MHTTNVLGIAQANNSQLNAMVRVTLSYSSAYMQAFNDNIGSVSGVLLLKLPQEPVSDSSECLAQAQAQDLSLSV